MVKIKEFRLGDIFIIQHVKKLTLPGKSYIMDKEVISPDGKYPYIAAISKNNGITGLSNFKPNNKGDCITLSTTADSSNTVFYQENDFIGRQQIAEIRRKDGNKLGVECGLFVSTILRTLTKQFNYANKLTLDYLKDCSIQLPSKIASIPDWSKLTTIIQNNGGVLRYE